MKRKGITPIIAIVILLLITIALAGAAWTFLQGVLLTQVAKSFTVPTGGAFCTSGKISVIVTNIGTSTIQSSDFTVGLVDGTDVTSDSSFNTGTIAPRSSEKVIDGYSCGSSCASGVHEVVLGTGSNVQTIPVNCA